MREKKSIFSICILLILFFITGSYAYAENDETRLIQEDEFYKKALFLKDIGEYDAAYEILRKLINESPNKSKYEVSFIDIILDQCIIMKESNDSAWKTKAKDAGQKIKAIYSTNKTNSDYYLIWAKYSWIVESKREANIYKALEKAFHYKPNYSYAHLVKGDIYFGLALSASDISIQPGTSGALSGGLNQDKRTLAETAKSAYESAISSPDTDYNKKAYIHFKLGELEKKIFGNKDNAKKNWEKTAALTPDTKFGKMAKEFLSK